jgi:hypothetical protein
MEVPFGDTQTNVARVARMMSEFARETQELIDRERGELRRVYGREA